MLILFFFFQAEDGIRDGTVTGVQTCALPIFSLVRGTRFSSDKIRYGRAWAESAPLWRRRHAHDRTIETGRDDRGSASPDRCAQRRGREGQSGSENDGRSRFPFAGGSAACVSRSLYPPDPFIYAGRCIFSSDHRRGLTCQSTADSRE